MRGLERLSALTVSRTKAPGRYADGGGLYLQVGAGGARSWIFRYAALDRRRVDREMGLGPVHTITLADARRKAAEARRLRLEGVDPIAARHAARDRLRTDSAKAITFRQASASYIKANRSGWGSKKHAALWEKSLATYAEPVFGHLPVAAVDTTLVLQAIEPMWSDKPETASRIRGRIEAVLDWAKARGYRTGANPAVWRGHLEKLLPAKTRVRRVQHHPALPYADIATFMAELRLQDSVGARALEFAILTAARTGEVLGARWSEVDIDAALWVIPAARMKMKRAHRVPLSAEAIAVLKPLRDASASEFVFPGARAGRPLSNMALLMVLRRLKRTDITPHGFRSTFRDWAAEQTDFPAEVAEMALAHVVADSVEAAYRRGDLLQKRVAIMAAWGTYSGGAPKT